MADESKVLILGAPTREHAYRTVFLAGKVCRHKNIMEITEKDFSEEEMESYIDKLISAGHESILEHINITFLLTNMSRIFTHQLVRHRIASYSQFSHRGKDENMSMFVPEKLRQSEKLAKIWNKSVAQLSEVYKLSVEEGGLSYDEARYILPMGLRTNIMFTMNVRSLRNFIRLRADKTASFEIQNVAKEILAFMKENYPVFVKDLT